MSVSSLIFGNTIMFVSINHRKSLNVLPMEDMCRMLTTSVILKVMALNEPHYLSEMLIFREEVSQRGLHFPRYRKEVGRKSFTYFGPALFIYISASLKVDMSLLVFKHGLLSDLLLSRVNN